MYISCVVQMAIEGPAREIRRFIDANTGIPAKHPPFFDKKGKLVDPPHYLCFHAFLPIPQSILQLSEFREQEKPMFSQDGVLFKRRCNSVSEWCESNWGTPWDIWDQQIDPETMGYHKGCTRIEFTFENAASNPPMRWLESVISKFPSLNFKIQYSIRDQFAWGRILGIKGHLWESDIHVVPAEDAFTIENDGLDPLQIQQVSEIERNKLPF